MSFREDCRSVLQRLGGVVLPFEILVRSGDADVPVARAAEAYRTVDLSPVGGFLVALVPMAHAEEEVVVARQPLCRTSEELAGPRPALDLVTSHGAILPVPPGTSGDACMEPWTRRAKHEGRHGLNGVSGAGWR